MGAILKILAILIITGGSSYGYFSSHRGNVVEKSEVKEIQQEAVNETAETTLIESLDENDSLSIQEAEKKVAAEVIVSEVNPLKSDDKKKEKKKENKEKSSDEEKEEEPSKKVPKPCFTIDNTVKYSEGVYYKKSFNLNGSCSKDVATFEWYLTNAKTKKLEKIGAGEKISVPLLKTLIGFGYGDVFEIKLVAISSDGTIESESKNISFRKIPEIKPCITPDSSETKELELDKEIEFDASCTDYEDENPVVKYSWTFRDGNDGEKETGKQVNHTFSKGATTFTSSACENGAEGAGLEVEILFETKLGFNQSVNYQYCIKK